MRVSICLLVAAFMCGGDQTGFAQNAETGKRLSARWCLSCHPVSSAQGETRRPRTLESIANMENVNYDKIVDFLLLPHARMPNLPLSHQDVEDIAAYIAQLKQ